jgi:hypothetical protein
MEGTGPQGRCVIALNFALRIVATAWLVAAASIPPQALAQAGGQGQEYTRLRSVVSRVAFQYIIGSAIDLPLTLRPCATEEERATTYDIVKRILAGEQADRAMQKALCHPHFGQPQHINWDEGSLTFDLPSKDCATIKNSIQVILQDRSKKSYTELFDRAKQALIGHVFVIIELYGGRHVFPNTTDTAYSKYFEFFIQECVVKGDRADLVILMRRRKGGTSDAR